MYKVPLLPLDRSFEDKRVFEHLIAAHKALAELKGVAGIIPNQQILIHTLSLQEAKDSSAIENIVTTHDELYKSDYQQKHFTSTAAKEVHSYAAALDQGYLRVKKQGLLTNNDILEIQATIEQNRAGFRSVPGTELKNDQTQDVIYTPPQDAREIKSLMENLETYINDSTLDPADPLIKMAIIHHQFESIHPFYDGNGRTGRIINVLYLVKEELLNSPILYLSRYINRNKSDYYQLLQGVREKTHSWEQWILFLLKAVTQTAKQTTEAIQNIKTLMQQHKNKIRSELPKIYSHELLNLIFSHPYTKVAFVEKQLEKSKVTATRYLNELTKIGIMEKIQTGRGKESYYTNNELVSLLTQLDSPGS